MLKCYLKGKTCRKWTVDHMILKQIGPQGLVCPHPGAIYMYITINSKIFISEIALPIKEKFYRKHLWEVYINNPGHMTKMAAMPVPSKIFSGTAGHIAMKLDMLQMGLKCYNIPINHDLVMILTNFKARST